MTGRTLSADELIKYFNGPLTELPQKGGPKDYAPDGSWLQAKRIEHFYKERTNVLSEERVKKTPKEITGRQLYKYVAKFWQTTGHVEKGKFLLYPEEALALVDKGDIEVYCSGLPMSVQECYATLLGDNNVPVEHYQVYIYLSRLGYVIFRHRPVEKLSAYEHKLGLTKLPHERGGKKKRKAKLEERRSKIAKMDSVETVLAENLDTAAGNSKLSEDRRTECLNDDNKMTSSDREPGQFSGCADFINGEGPSVTLGHSDFAAILFPSLVPGSVCKLQRPKKEYLPKGVSLQRETYVLESPRYTPAPKSSIQDELEFSYPANVSTVRVKARNWTEYKEQLRKRSEGDLLMDSPVGHLWKGKVTPLIKPSEAYSTASLLERMKIIQNINFSDDIDSYNQSVTSNVKLTYDVYKSTGQFSKTSPGLPVFRLCIKRHEEPSVTIADMIEASRLSPDGVPVQWAVVENGDVTFFSFHGVDIPTDTSLD